MVSLYKFCSWASFCCMAAIVLLSPWCFAAWEMWFFWPFVALIFVSLLFFSLRLISSAWAGESAAGDGRLKAVLVLSWLVFLAYAFVRFVQADVFMDAEKSFLLLLTPFLLGVQIVFGFDRKKSEMLWMIVLVNLFVLGLYGVVNHIGWKSTHVLWRPGYSQYIAESRATGTYFCPDHFAGIMELAFSLALGILLARGTDKKYRLFALAVAAIALVGVVMSKSRGGGMTLIVIGAVVLAVGFMQWPVALRWYWRATVAGVAGLVLIAFCHYENSYMTRFKEHFGWSQLRGKPFSEMTDGVKSRLIASCRGQMYSAALRAWKTNPVFGIGPGMHQNLWPHYAPSPDGNRELAIWPTFPNNDFHSYEVHSDWIQLMEEYGVVGLILFFLPFLAVVYILSRGLTAGSAEGEKRDPLEAGSFHFAITLGAVFSCAAMAFHSLGDFNLQMPATVWLLTVIIAVPLRQIIYPGSPRS